MLPIHETLKLGQEAASPAQWSAFTGKYKKEMAASEARHDLELLAALSHTTDFSVGCYCQNEDRCHRLILKQLLVQSGAKIEKS